MQSEQQQRIMGYFIEEAKDHLNTIEQGLLSLQSTMADTEMVNEVFRAAHSVKGGAAMLGINSIQKTAHRLEDCFKVLKESPVRVDHQLESLFLRVFDTLEALVEQLQGPFGLTDETASDIMSDAEPVFEELNTHLVHLVKTGGSSTVAIAEAPLAQRNTVASKAVRAKAQPSVKNTKALPTTFKRDVLVELREMLELFKQPDLPEHREALQEHCDCLMSLGEQADLPGWGELLETSRSAIAHSPNSYRLLASLVIKEIKQAQELVLANRSVEIAPSEQLKALVPEYFTFESVTESDAHKKEIALAPDKDFKTESTDSQTAFPHVSSTTNWYNGPDTYIQEDIREEFNEQDFTQEDIAAISSYQTHTQQLHVRENSASPPASPSDPEVGMAELNSLADIFEGQTPDLDQTWQEEEIISLDDIQFANDPEHLFSLQDQSDFSDLLGDIDSFEISATGASTGDDLMGWWGNDSTEEVALHSQESTESLFSDREAVQGSAELQPKTTPSITNDDFSDLLVDADSPDSLAEQNTSAYDLNNLFGDSFFEENSSLEQNTADLVLDADPLLELQQQDDDLFAMPAADALNEADDLGLEEITSHSSTFSSSPETSDTSANNQDFLSETFIGDEEDSLVFEDSFTSELEDFNTDEIQFDEAALTESEFDFDDLLEISDSEPGESLLTSEEIDLSLDDSFWDTPNDVTSDTESSAAFGREDFLSTDELNVSDNEAFTLEETSPTETPGTSALSSSQENPDHWETTNNENLIPDSAPSTQHGLRPAALTELSRESENALDVSALDMEGDAPDTAAAAPMAEIEMESEALNAWDLSSPFEETAVEDSLWDVEEPELALDESDLAEITNTWDLSNPFEETAVEDSLWDVEEPELALDESDLAEITNTWDLSNPLETVVEESLWGVEEPELALDETDSEGMDAPTIDFDLDATSTSPFNFDEESDGDMEDLFEHEAFSSVEESQNAAFNSLEDVDDLLGSQTTDAEALAVEGLDLPSSDESEAIPGLDNFFDAESGATDTSASDSLPEFEEFSLFESSKTTDKSDPTALESDQASELEALWGEQTLEDTDGLDLLADEPDALNFEQELFGTEASSQEWSFDLEEEATGSPEAAMDWDAAEFTQAAEGTTLESDQASELEALWGEQTLEETDGLDLLADEPDALNFEQELFGTEASSQEWSFDLEEEATGSPEAAMDWDTAEFTQAAEGTTLESDQASELEALWGEQTLEETDALDLLGDESDALNFEQELFSTEASQQEWSFDLEEEATGSPEAAMDWDTAEFTQAADLTALESDQASELEALWGEQTLEETDGLDLLADEPDALNFEQELFGTEASSQEWSFDLEEEATGSPEAAMDWDTAEFTQAADLTALESDQASELEALWGEQTLEDTDAVEAPEENLFETEMASDWDLESAEEAAEDSLDWEGAGAVEVGDLDDFLGSELDDFTDAQDGDEVLTTAQDSSWDGLDDLLEEGVEERNVVEDDFSFLTAQEADQAQVDEFDDLEAMLAEETTFLAGELDSFESDRTSVAEQSSADLEDLALGSLAASARSSSQLESEFDDLEAMLAEEGFETSAAFESADMDGFDDLEALLGEQTPASADQSPAPAKRKARDTDALDDEFGDLEILLEQADKTMVGPPMAAPDQRQTRPSIRARPRVFEQTMRVPVKHLDSLSNLVGELVVNRNSLEQDQERLRQFLDNLSHQVLALSDVGARMQDLYERSLLESSLLASRQSYRSSFHAAASSHNNSNSSGVEYDPLEMDRFTGFHLLSQEMIELIVRVRESASDIEFLVDETDQVARMLRQVTTQLQEGLTRSRMVPFAQNADRLLRAVHEISRKLGKEAQLHVDGRETLIDKMILEHLYDPMTHLVNNALTHGIEMPEVRRAAGKPIAGQITLRAFLQGNQTVISISDDGAGINPEKIRSKAIEKKLITPAEAKTLSRLDLYDFLFHPGFTTKDKADDFSGRGVGMDVVRTSLSEIRGTIHIDSTIGKGTTFTIRLPLTLSICKALCCLSERARLAFPMDGVEDMLDLSPDRIQTNSEGQTCIQWRDTLLPFQPLSELLKYNRQVSRASVYGGKREDNLISIVVLRSAGNFIAIQVDQVLGEQEIVIKQLEGPAPKPVGIAGATVLGDGRIMPIADVLELIDLAMGRIRKDGGVTIWSREEPQDSESQEIPEAKSEPMVLIVDDSITVRELLSMTFNKAGYRVEQARDGQEAWDKLRSGLPCDIVFCDIEMPRMDGLELLSRLQKEENLRKLPIAMLTSRGADRHRQMASQLGASGYFTKPYLEEVLLEAAQRMIKGEVLFGSSSNA